MHMSLRRKITIFIFVLCCFIAFGCIHYYQNHHRIQEVKPCGRTACDMAKPIINKTNRLGISTEGRYVLHTANFNQQEKILPITDKSAKNIMWLGGSGPFYPENLSDYDIILTTTPQLKHFLNNQGFRAYYLPIAIDDTVKIQRNPQVIAVIGDLPFIEDILQKKNIVYKKYSLKQADKIVSDMALFKAAFVENTFLHESTLDIHPTILKIAAQSIPMAVYWGWPNIEEAVNLFDDRVNFYMSEDDAERLVDELSEKQVSPIIDNRARRAQTLVNKEFSVDSAAKRLKTILEDNDDTLSYSVDNTLIFDLSIAVGHTGAGDYWLAQDIIDGLKKYPYQAEISFYNSPHHYPAETSIFVRGFLPFIYDNINYFHPTKFNIVYVAYAQFGDNRQVEYTDDYDTYVNNLIKVLKAPQVNALAIASKSLADALNKKGFKAHYVPQFTNIQRFYPDYHEELKSDVFFVGVNAFYRIAVPTLIKHGFPVTVFGPGWGELAQKEFLDNRDLHKYYSSAKIVLNDTREGMKKFGFVSNRIYDATACETLVISDYMPEIEEIYGDTVPMYKSEEELVNLVKYYLEPEHEAERLDKAKRAREITLKNFTAETAAEKFDAIIQEIKNEKEKDKD